MITEIGIICGEILELLEQRNGVSVFGEIHFDLKRPRDLIQMSLGWLLREGYVQILEDPLRACYNNDSREKSFTSEAFMFDLIVENKLAASRTRVKDIAYHISAVAGEILTLLEGCGNLLDLTTIERNLNKHRDIILMSLGWLIRERHVRAIAGTHETFIFRLPKEMASLDSEALCHA